MLTAVNSAHFDANQVPTMMGVIGTLGTADTQGTAAPLPFAVDPATGAHYSTSLGGTVTTDAVGQDVPNNVQGIIQKPLASLNYAPLLYAPLTQVTKNVIKATPGNVLASYITNDNGTVRYFQLHNKASAPASGDVPLYAFKIPGGSANNPGVLELDNFYTAPGAYFSTGISWAVSTAFGTFNDNATNTEHIVVVHYI